MKKHWKVIVLVIIVLAIIGFISPPPPPPASASVPPAPKSENVDTLTNKQILLGYLVDTGIAHQRLVALDNAVKEVTFDNLELQIAFIMSAAHCVDSGLKSKDKDEVLLANKVKKKLIAKQVYKFPLIRKAMYQHTKEICSEQNINVALQGNNDILALTGSIFANDENIDVIQRSIYKTLMMCRFKQARYFWSKYDTHYTVFTLETKPDSDLD